MQVLQPPNPLTTTAAESYDTESDCSTPYVSAPSSPARAFDAGHAAACGYFCSAPTSPMHYVLSKSSARSSGFVPSPSETAVSGLGTFEFDFSASCNETAAKRIESMSTADELFLNGQIRPLKPSETDFDLRSENVFVKSRDLRLLNKFVHRRARSMSPMRDTASFDWSELVVKGEEEEKPVLASEINGDCGAGDTNLSSETTPSASTSSSRCSSAGRSTNRWIFLKEFLRSKSEGRSNHKFWTNISFSPAKVKKPVISSKKKKAGKEAAKKPPSTAAGKRRVPLSAHELHYTANRAQAEEMRKKTYLPYRQGLLGCLGFSSKSYGAMNGFARALNPVSSR